MTHLAQKLVDKIVWSGTGALVGVVAGAASLRVARTVWGLIRGGPPPEDPESHHTRWRDALLWSGLTGLAGGMITVTLRRLVAEGWARAKRA